MQYGWNDSPPFRAQQNIHERPQGTDKRKWERTRNPDNRSTHMPNNTGKKDIMCECHKPQKWYTRTYVEEKFWSGSTSKFTSPKSPSYVYPTHSQIRSITPNVTFKRTARVEFMLAHSSGNSERDPILRLLPDKTPHASHMLWSPIRRHMQTGESRILALQLERYRNPAGRIGRHYSGRKCQ